MLRKRQRLFDNAIATAATTFTTTTTNTRIIRKPVSVAQQKKVYKKEKLSLRRRSVRKISPLSSAESEEEICFPHKQKPLVKQASYQQHRINKIEKVGFFDKMTITDYMLQLDTIQTMLFFGKS